MSACRAYARPSFWGVFLILRGSQNWATDVIGGVHGVSNMQVALKAEVAGAAEGAEGASDDVSDVSPELRGVVSKNLDSFNAAMNDDLNTPR